MKRKLEEYTSDADFLEFLNREFETTAMHATVEELAEFAFGSMKASIEAFIKEKQSDGH